MEGEHYIPDREMKKIDRVTSLMMESGWYARWQSWIEFATPIYLNRRYGYPVEVGMAIQRIEIQHIRRMIFLYLYLCGLSIIIFIAEILVSKWKKWRNRKHNYLN